MNYSFTLENLKESNDFLNILIDNINSLIFVIDKDVRIHTFNSSVQLIVNKPAHDLRNELFGNLINCKYVIEENAGCGNTSYCNQCVFRKNLLYTFTKKVPTYKTKTCREIYINGEKIKKHFQFTTRYIQYMSQEMILLIVDDITEIESQKIRLEELNSLKDRILSTVTHDLRNPIGAIQTISYFLLEDCENMNEEQISFVKDISNASEYMNKLVKDLLEVSKMELGEIKLDLIEQDFLEVVSECIQLNKVFADKKRISVHFDKNMPQILLHFDKSKISQVINNLLSNAIKYSFADTNIQIKILENENDISFEIEDEGQGIPEKEIGNIFKEFGKTSVKPTSDEESIGLGLAISKRIIKSHSGNIGVESKNGVGSIFYFSLPKRL